MKGPSAPRRPAAASTPGGRTGGEGPALSEAGPPSHALAVDWSGDARAEAGSHPKLWVAEAIDGRLVALEASSRQGAMTAIRAAADRVGPALVAGLDFAFSYPAWFLTDRGLTGGPELWDAVGGLAFDQPPFFGWRASRAPSPGRRLRRTEILLRGRGLPAKSAFQLSGPGSVGTGSRTGMPHLAELRRDGFAVWPFDPADAARPVVAEIYPRMATGPVVKSDPSARERVFDLLVPGARPDLRARAIASEDAFDAALSAVALSRAPGFDPVPEPAAAKIEGWVHGALDAAGGAGAEACQVGGVGGGGLPEPSTVERSSLLVVRPSSSRPQAANQLVSEACFRDEI